MARVRLRSARPEGEAAFYARTYPDGYQHDRWPDHVERVAASVELISRWSGPIRSAADLSCGDGAILRGLAHGLDRVHLGDLNGSGRDAVDSVALAGAGEVGPFLSGILPDTLALLPEPVDLFVLSETVEHLDDPDSLLSLLTGHARYLFLSTPVDEPAGTGNMEHYWGWGQADVHRMLEDTGWTPLELKLLTPVSTRNYADAYTFQLWMARRACDPE